MCDKMKHVCIAQPLILFKRFTCNQNYLCAVLSQHFSGGDMLGAADETSAEPLRSPLAEVLL